MPAGAVSIRRVTYDTDHIVVDERSDEQKADEAAFKEVEETILNIEAAVARAERAEKRLRKDKAPAHLIVATEQVIEQLDAARLRYQQRTYFATEERGTYDSSPQGRLLQEQQRMF